MSKRFTLISLSTLVLLILAGCGKPPEPEMQSANAAFEAARSAEAEQYAPEAYRAALDTLNAAQAAKQEADSKFALFRSYGKAKELFVKAEALAGEASTQAQANKEQVKMEVSDLLAQAKATLDSANTALAKAPRGKGSKADIELMKSDLAAAQAGYDDAMNDFNAGKYLQAKTKVGVVIGSARKVQQDVATALTKKKSK